MLAAPTVPLALLRPPEDVALVAWVTAKLGPVQVWTDHSRDPKQALVLRVDGRFGTAWVKQHRAHRKYRQEAQAYRTLVPQLADAGVAVPEALYINLDLRGLILSHQPGLQADGLDANDPRWPHLWHRAGSVCRALHQCPCSDTDPLPLHIAMMQRATAWSDRARGVVPDADTAAALDVLQDALDETDTRVWTHRDFSPRNWLVGTAGQLALIDFEHARPDHWMMDLVRNEGFSYLRTDAHRHAFFEGYGRSLTHRERRLLQAMGWFHAVGTVVWARRHQAIAFERTGRIQLAGLRALLIEGR
jgi:hypothetical protein